MVENFTRINTRDEIMGENFTRINTRDEIMGENLSYNKSQIYVVIERFIYYCLYTNKFIQKKIK